MSNVWPTIALRLYFLSTSMPEAEVHDLVERIMHLYIQSLRWKFTIDSSIKRMAVQATFHFAKLFYGANESWLHYFQRQFRSTASILSGTWIMKDVGDIHLLEYVNCLSRGGLQDLVVFLRTAKQAASANLYELL